MGEYYVGEITLVPYLRGAPDGWLQCDGSIQQISNYTALAALLGTTYGGDGSTTFGLPDLRSRVPVHAGQGPGLQNYTLGQTGGAETVTLTAAQLPQHTHQMSVANAAGTSSTPTAGGGLAGMGPSSSSTGLAYAAAGGTQVALAGVGSTGNSSPHNNIQPSQGVLYIICWAGVFPQQS